MYQTSVQYMVLDNIHGKEVCLVHPQDATLLLKDRLGKNLRKNFRYITTWKVVMEEKLQNCITTWKDWDNSPTTHAVMSTGMQISKSQL